MLRKCKMAVMWPVVSWLTAADSVGQLRQLARVSTPLGLCEIVEETLSTSYDGISGGFTTSVP